MRIRSSLLGLALLWLLSTVAARATFDAFLQFESTDPALKIEGESQVAGFEKAVQVYSFSLGISNPVSIGAGGTTVGRPSISDVSFFKRFDSASPVLFAASATGRHFDTVKLSLRTTGESGFVFLVYTFKQVYVSSVQWSGSSGGDDRPTESVSLTFASVNIAYSTQGTDGSVLHVPEVTWNQVLNKAE